MPHSDFVLAIRMVVHSLKISPASLCGARTSGGKAFPRRLNRPWPATESAGRFKQITIALLEESQVELFGGGA
jgi:hypothetical protein